MFRYLSSPIQINTLKVKNRVLYPALGLLYSYDGKLNDRYFHYFSEKAKGGAGIVTVGPVGINLVGSGSIALKLASDEELPAYRKLTGMMKDAGASPWVQLFHAGAYSYSILLNGEQPVAPSAIYSKYSKSMPREMSVEDIKNTQEEYVSAALRAKEAGFEGIEIIASAGYLITQFLSPLRNKRTDEYGGSFENRVRFPREVIEKVRAAIGKDFPLGVRIAGNDYVPGSNTSSETPQFAQVYEKAGVNIINVTGGWHEAHVPQLPMDVPRAGYSYLALNVKKAVSVPVVASNRINDPAVAERLLSDGIADMVSLGRVLIADPYWPKKAFDGRADEIRPCMACNQGCTDTLFSGKSVFCIANPQAGYEGTREITHTKNPKRVLVIGAGPGGLEAAVTAAQAGHDVELYEKSDEIGGQIWLAGAPLHKQEIWDLARYYKAMLRVTKVRTHLNTEIDIDGIRGKKPDFVIVAEGAAPLIPPIRGIDGEKCVSAWKVLSENPLLGKKIAVIGGGAVGIETALFLASKGTLNPETVHFLMAHEAESVENIKKYMFKGSKEVTVFEMLPEVGKDIGRSTKWVVKLNIERYGIRILSGAKVLSIEGGALVYERSGREEREDFDNIVVALGSRPVKKISAEIEKTGIPFRAIGDCVGPARLNDAIHGGFLAALSLDGHEVS